MDKMVQLVKYLAEHLVDNPAGIIITVDGEKISLTVDPSDMGKIIGKQGRVAKSIRSIVKSAAIKANIRVSLDIVDAADADKE